MLSTSVTKTAAVAKTGAYRLAAEINRKACRNWNSIGFSPSTSSIGIGTNPTGVVTRRLAHNGARQPRLRPVRGRKRCKTPSSKQQQQQQSQQRRRKATLAGNLSQKTTKQPTTARSSGSSSEQEVFRTNLRERINLWLNEPRRLAIPRWISPRMVTFRYSECFGHGSFFLVAVSYAVDDFLRLRLIAIAGSSAMLVFTYFHPHGRILWLPFQWNCVFLALNSWRVAKVYLDHYLSRKLPEGVAAVYDNHFGDAMEKTDFARLVRLGTIETYRDGDVVVSQGCENRYVRMIVSGDLEVDRDGQMTYLMKEGQFISEMGLHAGLGLRGRVTSCCSVKAASEEVQVVRWDRTELMHLLRLHKSIDRSLKAIMSWDIVSKLKSQRVLLASGKIDDVDRWTAKRREQSLARYQAILQNMLSHPTYLNERKDRLATYREIHQVGDSDHNTALQNIGWTSSEFEAGYKEGQLDDDELELQKLGFKWWCQSWWKALG